MSSYWKERLGLEPEEEGAPPKGAKGQKNKQAYEENLSKFKDERDAIQKKTFTKWVNKHLKKADRHVNDLFVDLQDGVNLISLLEVLSGEHLHREKGRMRFHMLQNVELVLSFLRHKKIKLVNIRPEDIVDGNPKLTLGLIWTIILHFQISDIVVGEEPNVSARDVLLRWAKRSTAKYPGVRVADFTQSWRDGLAFNAIIHRNRPELLDWRQVRTKTVRERLETAFHTAEKVGVTRLLDPEDVDTHEIDEKSIITYISSLYDVFPEPPANHPLHDSKSQALISEYREVASSLHLWLRENIQIMSERNLPTSLTELKRLSAESARFKTEEIPQRQRDKQNVNQIYRQLQKYFEAVGEVDIEPELHVDILERNWNRLILVHQERDLLIQEELKKFERLHRLVERITREIKRTDSRLDDLESRVSEEARRLDRLHPLDAKHNVDVLESEMRSTEEQIQQLQQDVNTLKQAAHPQASDLSKKVTKLHQRWVQLRSSLHSKLIARLASLSFPVVEERTVTRHTKTVLERRLVDTNPHFRSLQQAIDYCKAKLKQIQEADYGANLAGVKSESAHHVREHREIEQFQSDVETCVGAKANFHGDELNLYSQQLNTLQKLYAELLALSNKRLSDLETLLDFLTSVQNQMTWLTEKEKLEIARDWSDTEISISALEEYYEVMMSELEKREVSVRSVVERGESLVLQGHPGIKALEGALNSLQRQWAFVLQLTVALETHMKTSAYYQAWYRDFRELEAWIASRDELLNTTYSASEFSLDEGERLLKGMQELREELNSRAVALQELAQRAQDVAPIKQRRLPVTRPIHVHAVCNYSYQNIEIHKGDRWLLHDNSALTKWRVSETSTSGDTNVPGVVFLIPPPDRDTHDAMERLMKGYERTLTLWQRKQLRMRQNMIFATIRVVRSWDLAQFVAMGAEQRNAIRRALNEDAEKLLSEGDPSDAQLRRLRREMDEVNRLFDEFERRARQEEENKNYARLFAEQVSSLQAALDEVEKTLNSRISSSIPRDVHSLEHMVIQHKDFETTLNGLTLEVENLQVTFRSLPRKSSAQQNNHDLIMKQWNTIRNSSHLYIERLKCVEILLSALYEANNVVSDLEMKLATFGDMPSELEPLQNLHDDLIRLQNSIAAQQPVMNQLIEDATNTRRIVVKSRERMRHEHADVDRMDDEVNAVTTRWNNLCSQLVDRLRSCEAAYGLLENYGKTYQTEVTFIDEAYSKLNNLPPVTHAKHHIEPTKVLFTSIVERTQPLEQVNIDGGRFIREAKIHDMRLKRFREAVLESQPSGDAEMGAARAATASVGEEAVARQLDVLNHRFLTICAVVQDRMRQIAAETNDPELLELVRTMQPAQLRTFRTEFSLFDSSTFTDIKYTVTDSSESAMGNRLNGEQRKRSSVDEASAAANVIDMPGILDPKSGRMLTVGDAIRLRILDVRTGKIRSRDEVLTIEDAVSRGIVDPGLGERLLGPSGVAPGVSLLAAIRREIESAEKSQTDAKVSTTTGDLLVKRIKVHEELGRAVSLSDALDRGLVDSAGCVKDLFTGEKQPIEKALRDGRLDPKIREVLDVENDLRITLPEAIDAKIIQGGTCHRLPLGEARGKSLISKPKTLKEALEEGLLEGGLIQSPTRHRKVDLQEGIQRGVLDGRQLKSILDTSTGALLSLGEALDTGLVTPEGRYREGTDTIAMEEALEKGYLASVSLRSVFDVEGIEDPLSGEPLSLNDALDRGVVKDTEYVLEPRSGRSIPMPEAAQEGKIRPELWEMLDKKVGVMGAGRELSALGAALKGYLDPKTGELLDRKKKPVPYEEAMKRKMITREGLEVLISLTHISLTTQTVTKIVRRVRKQEVRMKRVEIHELPTEGWRLEEALDRGLLDPDTGLFTVPGTDRQVSFKECLDLEILHQGSAKVLDHKENRIALVRGLEKNVLDSTGHYVTKEGLRITLREALSQGRIILEPPPSREDPGRKSLTVSQEGITVHDHTEPVRVAPGVIFDPKTALVIHSEGSESLREALDHGRFDADSVRVRDARGVLVPLGDGLLSEEDLEAAAKSGSLLVAGEPLSGSKLLSTESISLEEDTLPSLGELTRNRVTTEPKYQVSISKARLVQQPECLLRKMKKRVLKPHEALKEGVIDPETAQILESNLEGDAGGQIRDPIRGDMVSVREALERGLVDNNGHLLVPMVRPLTLPEAVARGLYKDGGIVHPETGQRLTMEEAITCEILDPQSRVTTGDRDISLAEALSKEIVDPITGLVKTQEGLISVPEAAEKGLFPRDDKDDGIPPVGATLPVALSLGLYDPESNSVLDPGTGERVPLEEALRGELIMALPGPASAGCLEVTEALNRGLLEPGTGLYKVPETGERVPLAEAFDKGLLVARNFNEDVTTMTETIETRTRKSSSFLDKAKFGLLAVGAAPILLGRALLGESKKATAQTGPKLEVRMRDGPQALKEAIHSGALRPEEATLTVDIAGEPRLYTVREALDKGLVRLSSLVEARGPTEVALLGAPTVTIDRHLTARDLALRGAYDPRESEFLDPRTGVPTDFQDFALNTDLFNPTNIVVKDPETEELLPLEEALEKGLIDPREGSILDPRTGKKVPFFEALKLGWVSDKSCPNAQKPRKAMLSLEEALKTKTLDPDTGQITGHGVDTLAGAILEGVLDSDLLRIRDPQTLEIIPLGQALRKNVLNLNRDTLRDESLTQGYLKGHLRPDTRAISLEAAQKKGLLDLETWRVLDPVTRKHVAMREAVSRGIVDPDISLIKDPRTGGWVPLRDALDVDGVKEWRTAPMRLSLIDIVQKGYYSPKSRLILDPRTGESVTLAQAIQGRLVEPKLTRVRQGEHLLSTEEALATGLINPERGLFTQPYSVTLDVAQAKGYILRDARPWSLAEALLRGLYRPQSGLFRIDEEDLTLAECMERGILDGDAPCTISDGKLLSLRDAAARGLVDSEAGTLDGRPLDEALSGGLLVSAKRRYSLGEALFRGLYDPGTGSIMDPQSGERLPLRDAVAGGVLDAASTLVKVEDKVVTLGRALEEELVEGLDLREGFEKGVLVEVRRPLGLREAVHKGVYDKNTNLFLDLASGQSVPLAVALEIQLIDPNSVRVKDTLARITLPEAIGKGLVDGLTGYVRDPTTGEEKDLATALDTGLLVDAGSAVSLQRAIHAGLYEEKTGKILEPDTGRGITLQEAIRRGVIDPTYPLHYDGNKLLTLAECARAGIVDRRRGSFRAPGDPYALNLAAAMEMGRVLDIETKSFPLYDAVQMGLWEDARMWDPSVGRRVTLGAATREDLVSGERSHVRDPQDGTYYGLKEALEGGVLDPTTGDFPTGERLALEHVAPTLPVDLRQALESNLWDAKEKTFLDPRTNTQQTLAEGLSSGLISPDTTMLKDPNTGALVPLVVAPANLDLAVAELVEVRPGLENLRRASLEPLLSTPGELTLGEALKYDLLDPEAAVVKSPQTGEFVKLGEALNLNLVQENLKGTIAAQDTNMAQFGPATVYLREPARFRDALDSGDIDVEKSKYRGRPLREATASGHLDPDSVLVKDTNRRRLLKLPEAHRKGILDENDKFLADSHLYTLSEALDKNLLVTGRVTLLDALDYGLYNPTTGAFTDPFSSAGGVQGRRRLTAAQALESGLLDPQGSLLRDPGLGSLATLPEAIESGLLDPQAGRLVLSSEPEKPLDLLKAKDRGYILPAETRQAMEEKYKLCDESLRQLLDWISEVEDKLAHQDVAQEDLEAIRNQINILKLIKEEIDSQQRTVAACLDQVRIVVSTGSEYLTRDEVNGLERNGKSLHTRYDRAHDRTEKLLRRLTAAHDELSKFRTEVTSLAQWMEKARRSLDEKERSLSSLNKVETSDAATKEFLSDVIARQADLRFITMAAQKFFDESKEYLQHLNEFRTSLPSRLSHVEGIGTNESVVRASVSSTTAAYKELLSRANALADRLSGVGGRQREYSQALERFRQWFNVAEPKANKLLGEPLAADPHALEEQLQRTKSLHNEFVSQGRLVDGMQQASEALLRSVQGQVSQAELQGLETTVKDLTSRYERALRALGERTTSLDTALVQSQGVEDGLDSVILWLTSAENSLKALSRPASLIKDRLEEQTRELKMLVSDIESHKGSVDSVSEQARNLVAQATNPRLAKRIETKLRDVISRFDKLSERTIKRSELLTEVSTSLMMFTSDAGEVERWLSDVTESLSEATDSQVEQITVQRESRKEIIEKVLKDGRTLISKKDVTDTASVRDRIKTIETSWRELVTLLEERLRVGRARAEQSTAYEKLREQVTTWLAGVEARVARLEPVAVHLETIKRQADDLKPMVKEHRDYGLTIDKLFDLGNTLDSMNRPESPTRRRSSVSPVKRMSSVNPPLVRRTSHEGSPSPTKAGYSITSPISPGGSSGFGSRRSSQEAFHLEELTAVQQELTEINNRYSLVGVKLSDRQSELDSVREELRKAMDQLRLLDAFLDKTQRSMPRESLPATKEEADKTNKIIKGILEEMYEKQSLLESTKSNVNELVRRKQGAPGSDALSDQLSEVTSRWKSLNDSLKSRIQLLEDLRDLHDTHDNLNTWLNAKERMMNALGSISSDPRVVQTQIQQVQVLREELKAHQPQVSHLAEVSESALSRVPDSAESSRLRNKVSGIVERWRELNSKLDSRAESLGAAVDSSRELDLGLGRLRDALTSISEEVDQASLDKDPEEQLRKVLGCERRLEGVRPLLADAEAAAEHLARVLTDAASTSEIQSKLQGVNKQYKALQDKLDQRKAEIEAMLKDGREFEATCARTLGWLTEGLASMPDRLLISADRDVLHQQLEHHEPIYKEVVSKEHEIIMLVERGRERGGSDRQLETLRGQWDRLKREATDRHTRLQTSMEHCRKYYKALETWIPWLSQAENKLDSLRPDSFSRRDVEKHLRDLSNFRNEVWKKSGEFEHLRSLGDTFLGSCDIDKEVVKQESAAIKARWDKLNNEVLGRTSRLEEIARRLGELSDKLRDMSHSVQRCEDRLASHDSLGGAAASDPAMLHRLKGVKEDASSLRKPLEALKKASLELESEAMEVGLSRSGLSDQVETLLERLDDLESRLDDRCSTMQSAASAIASFNEKLKNLTADLGSLENELDSMKPPARDMPTLHSQQDQIRTYINKLGRATDDVNGVLRTADALVDSGYSRDAGATRTQAQGAAKTLANLEERARTREEEIDTTANRMRNFQDEYQAVADDIQHANDELKRVKPIGSEVETIRSQQDEFKRLRESHVEPLGRAVEEVNRSGQGLVQSAASGVSTAQLERDLESINDKWNTLKEKLNERGRKLDVGLLQSGKFQEALEGLNKWLTDTEEMVANQRPPSADYKVVKAQMQEQKFLKKMLLDRQGSMTSLFAMGNEVAAGADPAERASIERQLNGLMNRFETLTEGAAERMAALERAMGVAKTFQDRLSPVLDWLDRAEKRLKEMELVPTDEEKIQQRIKEHDGLHDEILRKKPALSELTDTGLQLTTLVGEEDAVLVADKLQEVTERYAELVEASESVGSLLQRSRQGLRHLVLTYQKLQGWMEGMESRLGKYRALAVHTDKLLAQMDDLADLTEEIANQQSEVDGTVDEGLELMKHITSDEAIRLKDKLDSLQRRYNELTTRGSDLLKQTQEALPLVQQFHNAHNRLVDWMLGAESQLQAAEPREEDITRLEMDIQEFRPVLENINQIGPQLVTMSPGEGASTIEGLVTRDNRRFDAIAEQIQRKAERLHLSKQRSLEVLGDIDSLLEWFKEVEAQLREAEPPSSEPSVIRLQLKEHKALNDDIASQKGRVRDVLSTAKKVLRESSLDEDASLMRDKMSDLRETMESVWTMSGDRLGVLEQSLGLAEHLVESHSDLASWLDEMESHVRHLPLPAIRPDLIAQQQDRTEMLLQSLSEHKPLVDKLNKTGEALLRLIAEDEGLKVQEMLDTDNARYSKLRATLKDRQETLEKALQESSQFSDKLEGMLRALSNTAEEVSSADPISAHVPKIKQQQHENSALIDDLHKREEAFNAVKRAAHDVISKAPNASDPAVKDVKRKLEKLTGLWEDVQNATRNRGRSLEEALIIAAKFWAELESVMATLADLEASLASQQPPAVRPQAIQQQRAVLQEIKAEMETAKPEVETVRRTGESLMRVCGEPDLPEVRKHIEDLDTAWDTVTALFAKREENLINAMEKAMEFHETLQELLAFLEKAEDRFSRLGALGSDIGTVKSQISELKSFKSEVDPQMVKVEALNRQASELTERTSADQAAGLKESLQAVNSRWDELQRGVAERNRQLENALLRLGQFQHALTELLAWIDATESTLDADIRAVPGDPQMLEVELAKLKVVANDIQAHQSSVDTLNDAGRQLIESSRGTQEASATHDKLALLNKRWRSLLSKAATRQTELEEALRDAQRFAAEIQDLLSWLGEIDGVIAGSKPVGGLPETAQEQLERFMDVYNELESSRAKVEAVLQTGQEYLKRAQGSNSSANTQANLKTLKQRWDSVTARANDKKIKLEIALKEATEFHDALQSFVNWLTSAEKNLSNLKPVSRVLETILEQIEEHKAFQKEVGSHRETMIQLDKKGTHLKYFSQKQDVILIKNLLISVQHRWERVVSKSAERTRSLDHGYKEAKEFHESWSSLMTWLEETEATLDDVTREIQAAANDPQRLKQRLNRHRETQKQLAGKQPQYDATLRAGKAIRERAPKTDEVPLKTMVTQLKEKWNAVCAKAVDRQRKLEEALLYCGQFKDALEALLDWLKKTNKNLSEESLVHGDLDTVNALMEQHRVLESELASRSAQMESVERTGRDLAGKAGPDGQAMRSQLETLTQLWASTNRLAEQRSRKLESALREAEELHKAVSMLLEWLSDAEMKLRFVDSLPDDDIETKNQILDHEKFMKEMREKEREKDATVALAERILRVAHPDGASVIRHWITIIHSRWEEVATWARQRETRLQDHLRTLQDMDSRLEELLAWLGRIENQLMELEREKLPDDIPTVEKLIVEHTELMEHIAERQNDVDAVCKAKQQKPSATEKDRRPSSSLKKSSTPSREESRRSTPDLHDLQRKPSLKSSRDNLGTLDRKGSRGSPGRDVVDNLPHFGPRFPPKGSKGSEPVFRTSTARLLYDRWRGVWLSAWERQRRLQEHLRYLQEVERLANFSWEDWRKRFLKFMNHKKSRLTDLFRKMDKNNDNLIPREDFIDGILKTKFESSRLEMGAVADKFDTNSEGVIDWKEFIAALRPDWEERRPVTEAEKIHDEVKRLVMLCTCRQKFRVFQVGEGKYRFGDSQKLRLVRILRSTVMVRVGGGWVALDEFLVKNDPCRAKGRTNVELREQFILADGMSQSMTAFKPKTSTGSTNTRSVSISSGSQGPITKVKERTSRSTPMTARTSRSSGGRMTPGSADSLSDTESSPLYARTPSRKPMRTSTGLTPGGSLPGSRNSSRPASRQGSKPPSHHGSSLSLASSDDGTPSRIPRRSVPARGSGTATPTARKLTVPSSLSNGRKSPSTTPLSATSPRARTTSGSTTPTQGGATPGAGGKLQRRDSTASDTQKAPRAPFRL